MTKCQKCKTLMEEIDNKRDQGTQILEKLSKCNVESDHESSDTSSSSVSEDEGSAPVSQSPNGTREKQSSPLAGVSMDTNNVSLEPFVHQVGGHIPMVCLDADTVCKPLIEREHRFYRSLPESLKRFAPRFEGLMHIEMQANSDGCIALTGKPPTSTHSKRRSTKRMKSKHKLHLLLQHLHNNQTSGEINNENQQFEWTHDKSKKQDEPLTCMKTTPKSDNIIGNKSLVEKGDEHIDKKGNRLRMNSHSEINDDQGESNQDLEFFYNPWALKCHQDHFKKLGLNSSNTISISSKPENFEGLEPLPKSRCTYLLLENVVSNHIRPCVLDLKVGARQYPDDCSSSKQKSKMTKSAQTTSATLGLRLVGMQVFDTNDDKYICLNKYHGRALNDDTFVDCIRKFLNKNEKNDNYRDDVRKMLITKLEELKEELLKHSTFRFYTSSLLVTYDGCNNFEVPIVNGIGNSCDTSIASQDDDPQTIGDNVSASDANGDPPLNNNQKYIQSRCSESEESQVISPLVDVRLIDFAHATHSEMNDKAVYDGPDDNFISGISNFISILDEL